MRNGLNIEEFLALRNSFSVYQDEAKKLSEENKLEFREMIENLNSYANAKEKGTKLEQLVLFIINKTAIFEGIENVRTSTNEIDILIRLSDVGKVMLTDKLINLKSDILLAECKNYGKSKIDVTMVGKFCSLLLQSPSRVGLFISINGFKGKGNWDSAKGLAKKFYYYKENDKYFILDIRLAEIEDYVFNKSFVDLIEDKIENIELDTNYKNLIKRHEAEDYFKKNK
ncbi:MAG: hypothetical protein ACRC6T_09825 [Sarcina sp.]